MVQGRRIAAILATLTAVLLCVGGSAGALTLGGTTTTLPTTTTTVAVPSVSTPTVSAPTVKTPKVSTRVASTPTATTPTVTAPKVSTPTVTTPKVSVPKVSTPKVSTPALSAPKAISKVTSPGGISLGGGGGGTATGIVRSGTGTVGGILSTGTGSGAAGGLLASPGGGTAGSGTNAIAGFPVFGGPGGGGPGAAPGGFPPGSYGGAGTGGGPTALAIFPGFAGPGAVHLTGLQALVASLAGCFYALTPFEQQVLVVRTGIDGRQPVSRTMLAGALGMTPAQLQRTERTAVRELRHASKADGCMPFAAAASLFTAASAFVGGPFGPLGYVTPALATAGRPGLLAATSSGGPSLAGGTTSLAERLAGLEDGGKAGPLWMIVLISLMFFLAAAALGREVRRSVH